MGGKSQIPLSRMRWLKFFLALTATVSLAGILLFPMGPTPFALGPFMDPFHGFWKNATSPILSPDPISLPDLLDEVNVIVDDRGVPHIFAQNDQDLYFAQGYIVAKDRLWQMDFQTRASAGTLSEVIGRGPEDRVLELDRYTRRKGLPFGAEKSLETFQKDSMTWNAIQAFSNGVNAYINSLTPSTYPIEFKLLGYEPSPWTPMHSALLQTYLSNTLSGNSFDIEHTNALTIFGKETFNILYPDFPYERSPVIPQETRWNRREILEIPSKPDHYHPDSIFLGKKVRDETILGSNNWAISPSKSLNGKAILANDMHLGLNLPAIWYELQLHTPQKNVYGVTLPGAPAVIVGFNDSIAWGATNGAIDVLDYYAITFRNSQRNEYLYDGQWLPTRKRIETFEIKGGEVYRDTVLYTHLGPVIYDKNFETKPVPLAIRWMAHEPTNELKTFLRLNEADNYDEYVEALDGFSVPGLNLVFASTGGDIAIWHQGKFVNRWEEQGRFILDGSEKEHMWQSFIPDSQVPHVANPPQGFVSSANQHPTSPLYPYYYSGKFEEYRNRRLNELLLQQDSLTVDDMKAFQLDGLFVGARDILPFLLQRLDTTQFSGGLENKIFETLKTWDFQYQLESKAPLLFEFWWEELYMMIWEDDFMDTEVALRLPTTGTTFRILRDSLYFSLYQPKGDSVLLSRDMLINRSFDRFTGKLFNDLPNPADWVWSDYHKTDIRHLTRILKPFGRYELPTPARAQTLNAIGRTKGPSWRMVVEMSKPVKAYGIYPGGQSGNPGSEHYDDFINDWVEGNYYELQFMHSMNDADSLQIITFSPTP